MNDSAGSIWVVKCFFPHKNGQVSLFFVNIPVEVAVRESHQLAIR